MCFFFDLPEDVRRSVYRRARFLHARDRIDTFFMEGGRSPTAVQCGEDADPLRLTYLVAHFEIGPWKTMSIERHQLSCVDVVEVTDRSSVGVMIEVVGSKVLVRIGTVLLTRNVVVRGIEPADKPCVRVVHGWYGPG